MDILLKTFETSPVKGTVEARLRDRIARQGSITFAEFMEFALYDAEDGYYTDPSAFGATGDYFTSPAAHPAFSALMAVQFQRMWELLGRPTLFHVVEMGGGAGLLARDVVDYARSLSESFARSLRYIALDRYAPQGNVLSGCGDAQVIVTSKIPLKGVVGCFISNELVDSFPVHRFKRDQETVKEVYVGIDADGDFIEVLDEPSTPMLVERLGNLVFTLPEGYQGEVNLNIGPWMGEVSAALARGFVVTIDYGYEAGELYAPDRLGGTLQTHYRHVLGGDPYLRIGKQDITAHVDFSAIASEGRSLGLVPLGLPAQSQFLRGLGFDGMLGRLRASNLSQRERDANVMAMLELVKPDGLGGFRVLIQERATGAKDLRQLASTRGVTEELEIPLLRPDHMSLLEGRYPHLAWWPEELWPFTERRE